MTPLPTRFNRDGYRCTVLKRIADVVLIKVHAGEHYEVCLVQKRPEVEIKGVVYPAREALPQDSKWGKQGWSFQSHEAALERFHQEASRKRRVA